eukprot:1264295-Pyramimonas_sp.AAC.1
MSSFSATVSNIHVCFCPRRSYSLRRASCARGYAATSFLLKFLVTRAGRAHDESGILSLCAGVYVGPRGKVGTATDGVNLR